MCVQSTFWRKKDSAGERLIVQLFNDINTSADHGLQAVEVPLREETVPIGGIRVLLREPGITEVRLEPEGRKLRTEREGDWTVVELPPLGLHAVLVAELGQ